MSAIVVGPRAARAEAVLCVGLVADAVGAPAERISLAGIDRVEIGRAAQRAGERMRADGAEVLEIGLADARLSSVHARITRLAGMWVLEDRASKNGTWVMGERVERRLLADGDVLMVGHTMLVFRDRRRPAEAELEAAARGGGAIELVGEAGSGLSTLARQVHAWSGARGRLVVSRGGDVAAALAEAVTGTLVLEEAGNFCLPDQLALMAGFRDGQGLPRLVSTNPRSLDAEVEAGRLRPDLRARLAGTQYVQPPLRSRREALGELITALVATLAPGRAVTFSADAAMALYRYDWPFNLRELAQALASALAATAGRIERDHLPAVVR